MNNEWRPKVGERVQLSIFGWLDGEKGEVTEVTEQAGRVACSVKIKGLKDEAIVYVENVKPIEDRYPPPFLEKGDEVFIINSTRYHGEKGVFVNEEWFPEGCKYVIRFLDEKEICFDKGNLLPLKSFEPLSAFLQREGKDKVEKPSVPSNPPPIPKNQLHYYENTVYIGLAPVNEAPHLLVEVSDGVFEFHAFNDVFGTRDNGSVSRSHWISPIRGGLECLRQHAGIGFEIYAFSSTREAFKFFLERLPKEEKHARR